MFRKAIPRTCSDWRRPATRLTAALISLGVCAAPAAAQRTDDNAATSAEDAFGRSVGDSTIGIYSENDVRGFSPADAGNLRINGLYYDQQGLLTSRLEEGSTIRVGISTQGYPFPAPTGIADYTLREPGGVARASLGLTYGPRGGRIAEIDLQLPVDGDRLAVGLGFGIEQGRRRYGGTPKDNSLATIVRFSPRAGAKLLAFYSRYRMDDDESEPFIFSSGAFLPKRFERNRFFGQKWNDYEYTSQTFGVIGNADVAGFDVRAGIFRSILDTDVATADLLFGTDQTGAVADRVIFRERGNRYASTSGEMRASRTFVEGLRRHTIIASVRGRQQDRRYGGGALTSLGPSRSDRPDPRDEPIIADGPKTSDRVDQSTYGIAYQGHWRGVGEVSLGIQRPDYRKRVNSPTLVLPDSEASPWLPSITAAVYLAPRLALYGGYVRGLEESSVAPAQAVNRNEAPPAIQTRQADAGLRWKFNDRLTAVAGVFEISKPYFNLDSANRFRERGAVANRGVELSLAGTIVPGLNIVAGQVLLDARISGDEVAAGNIGRRPIASFVRRSLVSLDYRPPWYDRLSVDVLVDSSSERVADSDNKLFIPARTLVDLGARYRFRIGRSSFLAWGRLQNVFNQFGWNVSSSGFFTPNTARGALLTLATDLE